MKHLINTIALMLLLRVVGYAQLRIDKSIPPSFNASAIIKYCDHPVGIEYGIPRINFPIRTLISEDLFIPINLNYHPLGIRVEEEATWAGLGWYLQAGGVITRIVRGENDLGISDYKENNQAKGYPFEHIKPCFDDCEENENDSFHAAVCASEIDSDPDIFFFDILGMKGKFLLTPDHNTSVEFIEIELISPKNMNAKYFLKENYWEVSDENNYTYTFKTKEAALSNNNYFDYKYESHKIHFDFQSSTVTTSWYLDKVTSPKGATANFTYDINSDGSSDYISDGTFQKMNINDGDIWDVHYSSYCFPEHIENVNINSQNQYKNIYLSSIRCGDYSVSFMKSEQKFVRIPSSEQSEDHRFFSDIPLNYGPQKLDKIEVKKLGKTIHTSELHYSYFESDPGENLSILYKRLRLDSLVTTGKKNRSVKFGYLNEMNLPSKESHARDLWGFYNGEEDLYNITPSDYFNYSQPEKMLQEEGRSKHYSLKHIQEGVLNSITYSGGKAVEYQYGHQEFYHIDDEISSHFTGNMSETNFTHALNPFLFGGLRVQEIVEHYPTESIYKEFDYTVNNKEDGKLIITHYSHSHHGYGHKTSGNHCVKYEKVNIKSGKLKNGTKF